MCKKLLNDILIMRFKMSLLRSMFFIAFFSFNAQSFESIKKDIEGELHLLRESIEKPNMQKSLYDIHFREFYYYLHNQNLELQWNELKRNQRNHNLNWSFLIPIEEQAILHFSEANTLWKQKKYREAIFLWKSLSKNQIYPNIATESIKILQEKLKQQKTFELYSTIDPYFLYNLNKNKTYIFSDKYGTKITMDHYWYFPSNNKELNYIQNESKTTVVQVYNEKASILLYLQKIRENQIQSVDEIILWMDWLYSWNHNTKLQYQFTRTKLTDNIYKVSFIKENDFTEYYEKYFLLEKAFIYIRVYIRKDGIDFLNNIQIKTSYE